MAKRTSSKMRTRSSVRATTPSLLSMIKKAIRSRSEVTFLPPLRGILIPFVIMFTSHTHPSKKRWTVFHIDFFGLPPRRIAHSAKLAQQNATELVFPSPYIMATYKIIRFYNDLRSFSQRHIQRTGLSLAEAQAWCSREDTSSSTHPKGRNGVTCEWFDGYEKE